VSPFDEGRIVARHRSPRGRAHRRHGAHRSPPLPIPLRGAAVAAITGSALSLIASTGLAGPTDEAVAALRLAAEDSADDEEFDDEGGSDEDGDENGDEDGDEDDDEDGEGSDEDDDVERRPSVEPVRGPDDAGDRFDVDELLESVKRAEAATEDSRRRAEEARGRRAAGEKAAAEEAEKAGAAREKAREEARRGDCGGLRTGGLGAVKPHVRAASGYLGCRFGKPVMLGVAGRGGPSDHPQGRAIDFMVNRATGDALAQCALDNMAALGVKYVIWKQRINYGDGWKPMADRGGVTANHFDHVHVSFERGKGGGDPQGC